MLILTRRAPGAPRHCRPSPLGDRLTAVLAFHGARQCRPGCDRSRAWRQGIRPDLGLPVRRDVRKVCH